MYAHCIGLSGHSDDCVRRAEAVTIVEPWNNPAKAGAVEDKFLGVPEAATTGRVRAFRTCLSTVVDRDASLVEDMSKVDQ